MARGPARTRRAIGGAQGRLVFITDKASGTGVLRVLSGDDGRELTSLREVTVDGVVWSRQGYIDLALAEVNLDGETENLGFAGWGSDHRPIAPPIDGTVAWMADTSLGQRGMPAVADIFMDGEVEFIDGSAFFHASTGAGTW